MLQQLEPCQGSLRPACHRLRTSVGHSWVYEINTTATAGWSASRLTECESSHVAGSNTHRFPRIVESVCKLRVGSLLLDGVPSGLARHGRQCSAVREHANYNIN